MSQYIRLVGGSHNGKLAHAEGKPPDYIELTKVHTTPKVIELRFAPDLTVAIETYTLRRFMIEQEEFCLYVIAELTLKAAVSFLINSYKGEED